MIQDRLFPECPHSRLSVIPQSSGPHAGREVCSDCHKFVRWVPKTEADRTRSENMQILSELVKLDSLGAWERRFVRDLATHKNITARQRAELLELRDRYFSGGRQ